MGDPRHRAVVIGVEFSLESHLTAVVQRHLPGLESTLQRGVPSPRSMPHDVRRHPKAPASRSPDADRSDRASTPFPNPSRARPWHRYPQDPWNRGA